MFNLIIIIIIFYIFYKKYQPTPKLIPILQAKGFSKITTIKRSAYYTWIIADFHGDNYLFEVIKNNYNVSSSNINELIDYSTKEHYHNVILVPGNSVISRSAKSAITSSNIQIWNNEKLASISKKSRENASSAIIQKKPIHDNCKIEISQDPIQDGAKANSIFSNFFGNKTERL